MLIQNKLAHALGNPVATGSDEIRFCCPFCTDKAYRMYVNPAKGKFFCQKCTTGGSLDYLLLRLNISWESTLLDWDKALREFMFGPEVAEKVERTPTPIPETIELFRNSSAAMYLASRGLSFREAVQREISIGKYYEHNGRRVSLKNRLVFPNMWQGVLEFWVARTYDGNRIKYRNPPVDRSDKIYNLEGALEHSDIVVVTEGVLSGIAVGYEGTSTYGKYVTGKQIRRYANCDFSHYYVALDGDARKEAISVASRLWQLGKSVSLVRMPVTEDPSSLGRKKFAEYLKGAESYDPLKSLVMSLGV